jgi:DNA-binding NtrC family response regulator
MRRFQQFHWPGNVRELRNTIESMMVLAEGDVLTERDLPDWIHGTPTVRATGDLPSGLTMDELEKLAIIQALEQFSNNRTRAAQKLGISVRTLQRKLQHYKLGDQPKNGPATHDILSQA